ADFVNIDAKTVDVDWLRVNLSAATEKTYSKIHTNGKRGLLKEVIRNIENITKNHHTRVTVVFIITELNWKEIEKAIRICLETGVKEIAFKLMEASEETKSLILSHSSARKLQKLIEYIMAKEYRIRHNLNEILETISAEGFGKDKVAIKKTRLHNDRYFYFSSQNKKYACYIPWFYSYIDVHGRVIAPCDNGGTMVMGNVKKEGFRNIWFSDKYMKARIAAKNGIDVNKKRWQQCRYCTNIGFNKSVQDIIDKHAAAKEQTA
ncbi:hypothetical protein DRQ26_06405, partial [bacterium]